MATTFQISNRDVVISRSTGRPNLVGNAFINNVVNDDPASARDKLSLDLARCLSLENVRNGTTADLKSLVGTVPQFGSSAVGLLVSRQIRSMVATIIREQSARPNVRPNSEKIRSISLLQVFPDRDTEPRTSFRFRLGIRTQAGNTINLTGEV